MIVLCPVGFVAEQVEILYDIDVALMARAHELGVRMERTPMLDDGAAVVAALAELVRHWEGGDGT